MSQINFRQWREEIEAMKSEHAIISSVCVSGCTLTIRLSSSHCTVYWDKQNIPIRHLRTYYTNNKDIFISLLDDLKSQAAEVKAGLKLMADKLAEPHVGTLVIERLKGTTTDGLLLTMKKLCEELNPYIQPMFNYRFNDYNPVELYSMDEKDGRWEITISGDSKIIIIGAFGSRIYYRRGQPNVETTTYTAEQIMLFVGNFEFIKRRVVRFCKAMALLEKTINQ